MSNNYNSVIEDDGNRAIDTATTLLSKMMIITIAREKKMKVIQQNKSPTGVNGPYENFDFNRLPKISPTEELILLLLHNHECYGLQIIKAIERATQGQKKLNVGSLYPTLNKLEEKDLITSHWGDERRKERGGARRRYYQITEKGRAACKAQQALRDQLREWEPAFSESRNK